MTLNGLGTEQFPIPQSEPVPVPAECDDEPAPIMPEVPDV